VATLEPRKNILRLIKAFVSLNLADYQLVLAGKPGWGSLSLPQADNIIYPGFISDRDLPTLYSGADFFVYPSLYEGFGLPVLEAMACGTPVITSNISSLPEIVGQAGLLINPKSQTELETAILKLVKTPNLCRQYSKKGIVKARQFNWPACAQKTLDLYHQVYKPK